MKKWVGISLGIHVAVFGFVGVRPAPSRNLIPPGKVYSVNLVSIPVARPAPAAKPVETKATKPETKVEPVKPKPRKPPEDKEAVKPPSPEPKKTEEKKEPEPKTPEPEEPEAETPEEPEATGDEHTAEHTESGPGTPVVASALGESSTQGTVSLDVANFGFSYYLVALQAKVASNWFPPGSVGSPGEVVRATIHFRVMDDGTIEAATVETSSGVPYFDRCALRAILLSSPLAPLPQEFEEDELGVHFEFSHTVSHR